MKKASVKKTTKRTAKKTTKRKPSVVIAKKPVIVESTMTKLRSFWKLFDRVKNHNFQMMVQRGNDLNDFIRIVEEMPESIFRHVFIEAANLTPVRHNVYVGCECPADTYCFCAKYKTTGVTNEFNDYLKAHDLQRYEVEIQHLRHLIKLQTKGVAVPESYSIEEFFKRSDAPGKQTSMTEYKPSPVNTFVEHSAEDKETSRAAQLKLIVDAIKKNTNVDAMLKVDVENLSKKYKVALPKEDMESQLKEFFEKDEAPSSETKVVKQGDPLWEKFFEKKRAREDLIKKVSQEDENKSLDLKDLSLKVGQVVETRPNLHRLAEDRAEIAKKSVENHIQDTLDFANNAKEAGWLKEPAQTSDSLKSALAILTKYADVLGEPAPTAPTVVASEEKLPSFWQDLKKAREEFDKFSQFYARKYADYVDSLRDLNKREQEYLASDKPSDKYSLQNNVLRHLNAQRDLEVLKKVLNSAYEVFRKSEISQVDLAYLQAEMSKYVDPREALASLFDHLSPKKEVYEREMARRKVSLAPIVRKKPSPSAGKMRTEEDKKKPVVVESYRYLTELEEDKPVMVSSKLDLTTKEGRAEFRKRLVQQKDQGYMVPTINEPMMVSDVSPGRLSRLQNLEMLKKSV